MQTKINTLNSLLPSSVPFIASQVGNAVALAKYEYNIDMAIKIAELVKKHSNGDIFYNHIPVLVALLLDYDGNLEDFDTNDHKVPLAIAQVRQFMSTYADDNRNSATQFKNITDDNTRMILLACLIEEAKRGVHLLNIAYLLNGINSECVNWVNVSFELYNELVGIINKAEF